MTSTSTVKRAADFATMPLADARALVEAMKEDAKSSTAALNAGMKEFFAGTLDAAALVALRANKDEAVAVSAALAAQYNERASITIASVKETKDAAKKRANDAASAFFAGTLADVAELVAARTALVDADKAYEDARAAVGSVRASGSASGGTRVINEDGARGIRNGSIAVPSKNGTMNARVLRLDAKGNLTHKITTSAFGIMRDYIRSHSGDATRAALDAFDTSAGNVMCKERIMLRTSRVASRYILPLVQALRASLPASDKATIRQCDILVRNLHEYHGMSTAALAAAAGSANEDAESDDTNEDAA